MCRLKFKFFSKKLKKLLTLSLMIVYLLNELLDFIGKLGF